MSIKNFNTQIVAYNQANGKNENCSHSHPAPRLSLASKRRKSHKGVNLWELSQAKEDVSPYLQIASVPINERIDPKEVRYILVILPHGIRAVGGQYSADEANEIAKATRGWDWSLDENQRPKCLGRLEAILDSICKRSALAKEGGGK